MNNKYTELKCPKCNSYYKIRKTSLNRRKQNNSPDLCKECLKIHNGEFQKQRQANMSEEEKRIQSERAKK